MSKRKSDRSRQRDFTWGIRASEAPVVHALLAVEPLNTSADCGCGMVRPVDPRRQRPAGRRAR